MKKVAALVASIAFFAASSAFATDHQGIGGNADIEIHVHDVEIYQAQDGTDMIQRAAIARVDKNYAGTALLHVHNASIQQQQKGQGNTQTATIASICDCEPY